MISKVKIMMVFLLLLYISYGYGQAIDKIKKEIALSDSAKIRNIDVFEIGYISLYDESIKHANINIHEFIERIDIKEELTSPFVDWKILVFESYNDQKYLHFSLLEFPIYAIQGNKYIRIPRQLLSWDFIGNDFLSSINKLSARNPELTGQQIFDLAVFINNIMNYSNYKQNVILNSASEIFLREDEIIPGKIKAGIKPPRIYTNNNATFAEFHVWNKRNTKLIKVIMKFKNKRISFSYHLLGYFGCGINYW